MWNFIANSFCQSETHSIFFENYRLFNYGGKNVDSVNVFIGIVPAGEIPIDISVNSYDFIHMNFPSIELYETRTQTITNFHWSPTLQKYMAIFSMRDEYYERTFELLTADSLRGPYVAHSTPLVEERYSFLQSTKATLLVGSRSYVMAFSSSGIVETPFPFANGATAIERSYALRDAFIMVDDLGAAFISRDHGVSWTHFAANWTRQIFKGDGQWYMWDYESGELFVQPQ